MMVKLYLKILLLGGNFKGIAFQNLKTITKSNKDT